MSRFKRSLLLVLAVGLGLALAGIVLAAPAATLPVSKGVYRLPYADDTNVLVANDHTTHPTVLNRLDISGTNGSGDYTIVAAGEGWVRWVEDQYSTNCPPGGGCNNNFIWIEHPNGEWTKYSHIALDSALVTVGQYVVSGTPLGLEGDVGQADNPHLHFEVAEPYTPYDPEGPGAGTPYNQTTPDGTPGTLPFRLDGYFIPDGDGDDSYNRQNRIPIFCGLDSDGPDPGQGGPVLVGETYTATVCQVSCPAAVVPIDGVFDGEINHFQADDEVFMLFDHVVAAGGGEAFRAGERVILSQGFHAEEGSYFSASIGACDSPGAQ